MADERDDQINDNEGPAPRPGSKASRRSGSSRGRAGRRPSRLAADQSNQRLEGSFGGQIAAARSGQSDGTSGQPIGGNDSNTGTGTTSSQGADFGGQSSSGQAQQRTRTATR